MLCVMLGYGSGFKPSEGISDAYKGLFLGDKTDRPKSDNKITRYLHSHKFLEHLQPLRGRDVDVPLLLQFLREPGLDQCSCRCIHDRSCGYSTEGNITWAGCSVHSPLPSIAHDVRPIMSESWLSEGRLGIAEIERVSSLVLYVKITLR